VKALVLAGGFGTRLRPLTLTRPKHVLPIANRPHIDHVFELLARHRVDEVVLLTSYLATAFGDVLARAAGLGLTVEVTHELEPLGTAGALKNAQDYVAGDTFLVFNGDILTDVDLLDVLAWHRSRDAEATILLTPVSDPSAYGVVSTEAGGRVLDFIEKPALGTAATNLINAGVYVFEPSVLELIPSNEVVSAERQLFPRLVAEGARMFGRATDAYWMDIGTPEKYLEANLDALAGRFSTTAVPSPGDDLVLSATGVRVAEGARVSSSCLGAGSLIEEDATVERAVLLPGAAVRGGARVERSILGQEATVLPGAQVVGRAIADGDSVKGVGRST
jgi:mannose-1-phosphate guanylyltransferase